MARTSESVAGNFLVVEEILPSEWGNEDLRQWPLASGSRTIGRPSHQLLPHVRLVLRCIRRRAADPLTLRRAARAIRTGEEIDAVVARRVPQQEELLPPVPPPIQRDAG